jgi:valyl-tRNA synthetase
LFVPLGELVDFEKEIERLEKELATINSEIARASGKLSNNGFLEKAPKSLVDSERAKLDKFIDMKEKLVAQLNDLKG